LSDAVRSVHGNVRRESVRRETQGCFLSPLKKARSNIVF
jgi:hypothetical protein